MREGLTAVPVVEVVRPSSQVLIEPCDDYFLWQREVLPACHILDLLLDAVCYDKSQHLSSAQAFLPSFS
jgi:hypothetical protein